jgi:hypothetical protein
MKKTIIAAIIAITSITGFAQTTESTEAVTKHETITLEPGVVCTQVAERMALNNRFRLDNERWTVDSNSNGVYRYKAWETPGVGRFAVFCYVSNKQMTYIYRNQKATDELVQQLNEKNNKAANIKF